jgi:hypothetical protein
MMINWRELRDTMYPEGAISTINHINHRGIGEEIGESAESKPMVNSADMVKRSKFAPRRSDDPMVKSANGAKSRPVISEDSWEWVEERSAIMENEGGLTRKQANYEAFLAWFNTFVGGIVSR